MNRSFPLVLLGLIPYLLYSKTESIDYSRDILPILSQNCFECHGPDEGTREADLRLDTPDGAYADIFGAVAVKPGYPEDSELIYRIEVKDKDDMMPPPDSKKTLSTEEKELLHTWIKEGGQYDSHWAFQIPKKADIPNGAKHPVDFWVRARLSEESLDPSNPANPNTLIRRISLDLTGLPPSPQEIEAYLRAYKKNSKRATEALIDDLMARPTFGEKWARHWLDIARYSDTNGFEKDKPRDQWAYRDWVINAINDDLPYDQFLIEQLAGDLIPNRTQDQLIASGFMRNGMVNEEGAIVPEQFRLEGIFDRMDTFGKATIGLTLQCAQCHTHKFDPITHDEYFQLFAFFNETHEAKSWIYSDKQLSKIQNIKSEIVNLENQIRKQRPLWAEELAQWKKEQIQTDSIWEVWDTHVQDWKGGLNHPEELDDHSILTLGHPTVTGYSIIEGEIKLPTITGIRLEALLHGDQPFNGPGRSYWGTFAISEMEVYRKSPGEEEWTKVELKNASADFETKTVPLKKYFRHKVKDPNNERLVGPVEFMIDGDETTAWAPDRGPVLRHTESVAVIQFDGSLSLPEGSQLKIHLIQNHGGDGNDRENQQLGRYRFSLSTAAAPQAPTYDHAVTLALQKIQSGLSDTEEKTLFRAWRQSVDELELENKEIAELEANYPEARTSVLHSKDTTEELARVTRLLDRGTWDSPKHEIKRNTPAVLNPMLEKDPTRLDLANWVTSDEAPLTARVQVNRVWQAFFGTGLVTTSEDFGTRAPKPEYLEILDWLAVDFMENNWSLKTLIKTILVSETYQQSSQLSEELNKRDPRNVLLARGPRFRAEAEVVRDIALAASGLLTHKLGGPSIYPPVPQSVLDYNYVKPDYWDPATDDNRYRRSLYLFRKRSMPDPVLSSFDAPNADVSCARRVRSNTPLSALTSLNETIFVEASQGLALRILREGGTNDSDRVNYGYLLTTGRPASRYETKEILNLINSQKDRLAEGWLDIRKIAFRTPDTPQELPKGISPLDVASWTIASRVLLNLDETLTKN